MDYIPHLSILIQEQTDRHAGKGTQVENVIKICIYLGIIVLCMSMTYKLTTASQVREESQKKQYNQNLKDDLDIQLLKRYIMSRRSNMPKEFAVIIAQEVHAVSKKENVPLELVVGIIETESIWNAMAISDKGARGLMQILKADKIEINFEIAHDIPYNLEIGVGILKEKMASCNGNLPKALYNYSGGKTDYAVEVMKNVGRFQLFKSGWNNY